MKKNYWLIIIGIIITFLGVLVYYFIYSRFNFSTDNTLTYFNLVISFMAIIGTIYIISLQTEELGLQRVELKNQIKEFETMNFNNLFFNLINTQNQVKNCIEIMYMYGEINEEIIKPIKGENVFIYFVNEFHLINNALKSEKYYDELFTQNDYFENNALTIGINTIKRAIYYYKISKEDFTSSKESSDILLNITLQKFYNTHKYAIVHYFNHLEQTIKLIRNNKNTDYDFLAYLKSQITLPEKLFIIYYAILDKRYETFLKESNFFTTDDIKFMSFLDAEHRLYFKGVYSE